MKVRATQLGYYNLKRRRVGDVFTLIKKEDFSEKWMADLSAKPQAAAAKAAAARKPLPIKDADGTIIGYQSGKSAPVVEQVVDEVAAAEQAAKVDELIEGDLNSGETQSDQHVI